EREVERFRGCTDAADAAHQLADNPRPLRIAEVEVVGERQRLAADGRDVAPGFGHRLLAAFEWIGLAVARRHVGSERERLWPLPDPHDRGVATWPLYGVAQDDVVVLLPDPALRTEIGRADQFQQRLGRGHRRQNIWRFNDRAL